MILDSKDIEYLSQFYINLLGWPVVYREENYWLEIKSPDSTVGLAFQKNDDYDGSDWAPFLLCNMQIEQTIKEPVYKIFF